MKPQSFPSDPGHPADPRVAVPVIEAVVQTAAIETAYRRAGRGAPVLLLSAGGARDPLPDLLLRTLASRFRVIVPEVNARAGPTDHSAAPLEPVAVSAWLRDVIDGLGLERPSIVADEACGIAALAFLLLDPQRVERLVVLRCDHPDPADPRGAVEEVLGPSGHPFLLLRLESGDETALAASGQQMIRFLNGGHDAPQPALSGDP